MNHLTLASNLLITRDQPVSIVHFITNRCNARCSFCFIDFDDPETFRGELTVEEIEKLTKSLGSSLLNVNLTGGEPFARKELSEIASLYYKNTNIQSIYLTTNGSLPDRAEKFAAMVSKDFPDRKLIVSVSIDDSEEKHDKIRKIKGLFKNAIDTYHRLDKAGPNIWPNVSITVSKENHHSVMDLYETLVTEHGVKSLTAVAVRDEGVYSTPKEDKEVIHAAYLELTSKIHAEVANGRLRGFDTSTVQGRVMNKKNEIVNDIIADTYIEHSYRSPCHAGTLFGVIHADGKVYPCEVLEKPLGNLRDYEMDFAKLWGDTKTKETAKWIKDTKCCCTYECAWTLNVLGNWKYQPALLGSAFRIW